MPGALYPTPALPISWPSTGKKTLIFMWLLMLIVPPRSKDLSDVICTSGNAVSIVNQVPADREILFVPDQNLGQWVMGQTGRKMRLWPGSCYAHVLFTRIPSSVADWSIPDAPVVAHPRMHTIGPRSC